MDEMTNLQSLRERIGVIALSVYLWAFRMTYDEFVSDVLDDARREYESDKANAWMMK
jgi:hypothetical protein